MSLNTLFISDTMIKERSSLHGNTDPKLIYNDIKTAQDMYILPILGTALFNKIQTIISDGTITSVTNADYKTLLDNYIVDALIFYTLSDLPTTLSYQLWNKGVVRKLGEDTELPSMSELVDISNKYKNKAEFYANRLKLYCIDQSSKGKIQEYILPGNTIDTITPEQRAFTLPIYLGDDRRDNPYCNPGGFNGQPYHD